MERVEQRLEEAMVDGKFIGMIFENNDISIQNLVVVNEVRCSESFIVLETSGIKNESN